MTGTRNLKFQDGEGGEDVDVLRSPSRRFLDKFSVLVYGFKNIFSEKLQTKQAEMVQWNPSEVDDESGLSGQRFSFFFNQPKFS